MAAAGAQQRCGGGDGAKPSVKTNYEKVKNLARLEGRDEGVKTPRWIVLKSSSSNWLKPLYDNYTTAAVVPRKVEHAILFGTGVLRLFRIVLRTQFSYDANYLNVEEDNRQQSQHEGVVV